MKPQLEPTTDQQIRDFLDSRKYAYETRERYRYALVLFFAEVHDVQELTASRLYRYLDKPNWGDSMRYVNYRAIIMFIRWRFGNSHPALELKLRPAKYGPQRVLKPYQVKLIMDLFDDHEPAGIRNLAIVSLMVDTGLRAAEVCRLELKYLQLYDRSLFVRIKGGRWAKCVFSKSTRDRIGEWLKVRKKVANPSCANLFVGIGGNTPGDAMTRYGLRCLFTYWGQRSGIGKLSPHDLRRTFATVATRAGAPERVLMAAGRWTDSTMIKLYTQSIEPSDFEPYFPMENIAD